MAKAKTNTNVDRRIMLSLIAGAATAAAAALASVADPIFQAIEEHKRAYAAFNAIISTQGKLESELPKKRRQSSIDAWNAKIVETDDPRWIAAERQLMALASAEADSTVELVNVKPTTSAGISALLQYVIDLERRGHAWPHDLCGDDEKPRSFEFFLHSNIAEFLSDRPVL